MAYIPKACGFVVVRPAGGGLEYLLLTCRKWSEAGFPKGHVDEGESELETARRETEEEAGLGDLEPLGGFRAAIRYPVRRKKRTVDKEAVYYVARPAETVVRLSDEHTAFGWYPYDAARERLPHESTRAVLRQAALFLKDPALFASEPRTETEADAWLAARPQAHPLLLGHVRGAARLARAFAKALAEAGAPVHEEATAVGALLHDTGRAFGRHDDHQRAGLLALRETSFAPYGFACLSHFTKGAAREELLAAGLPEETVADFERLLDATTFTPEEQCVALADACMDRDRPVAPEARFASLRERYDADALIDLQERRTAVIRADLARRIGRDPLAGIGLDG